MASSASPHRSSGSGAPGSHQSSEQAPRLDAFQIDALLGNTVHVVTHAGAFQCTGWEAEHCIADIEAADLISLRFDPLPAIKSSNVSAGNGSAGEAYYKACAASLDHSLPVRLGLCCCRWQPSSAVWELRSHEMGLWPGDLLEIPEDLKSRRFRAAAEADMIPQDVEVESSSPSRPSRWSGQLASASKWVVAAVLSAKVPVVVHNGLLDLLHLSDKFCGHIPEDSLALGHALSNHFPVIFDTCLMTKDAAQNPIDKTRLLSLEEMHKQLAEQPIGKARLKEFGLYTHRASSKRKGLVFGRGIGSTARDAMCIAEAFLLEMGRQIGEDSLAGPKVGCKRTQASVEARQEDSIDHAASPCRKKRASTEEHQAASPCRKKRASTEEHQDATPRKLPKKSEMGDVSPCKGSGKDLADSSAPGEPSGELLPSSLSSHVLCRHFHNRVAAAGVPCLHLRQPQLGLCKGVAINLRSLLRELGAKEDSQGRPVVTHEMTKQLRRMLSQMKKVKGQQDSTSIGVMEPQLQNSGG